MQKNFFHNNKPFSRTIGTKQTLQHQKIDQKRVVDINKLLNRVRIEEKEEIKRKVFFYSSVILAIGLLASFILIIK